MNFLVAALLPGAVKRPFGCLTIHGTFRENGALIPTKMKVKFPPFTSAATLRVDGCCIMHGQIGAC